MSCESPDVLKMALSVLGYAIVEFYLGKTKRIRPNSVIELLIVMVVIALAVGLTKVRSLSWNKKEPKN